MEKEYLVKLQLQKAEELVQAEDIPAALILLEHILDSNPLNIESLFMTGQCYLLLGSTQAAQDALHQCHIQMPDNEEILCALTIAHFEACCFESVLVTAEMVLNINPDASLAWRYIGLASAHLRHPEDAAAAFKKSFSIHPEQNPLPLTLPDESLLEEALASLPFTIQLFYQQKTFRTAYLPD